MPVKRYGIYLEYPPTVDLRAEGLGRYLAQFLKGAGDLRDTRFIIVCPSWSRETLEPLFESEGVPSEVFEIVTPKGKPYVLRLFQAIRAYRERPRRQGRLSRMLQSASRLAQRIRRRLIRRAVAVHDAAGLASFLFEIGVLLILLLPLLVLALPSVVLLITRRAGRGVVRRWARVTPRRVKSIVENVSTSLISPQRASWTHALYDDMQVQEARRIRAIMATANDVRAWYCPTAFWPSFNDIPGPRLTCVPDVVMEDFPVGFSMVGSDRVMAVFDAVGDSIRGGQHFVTYSEAVKWNTLVDRYGIAASNVTVIPHAPNLLNHYVDVAELHGGESVSRRYCKTKLISVFQRSSNTGYASSFQNDDVKFIFYASQFRPNKNVLTLLRAYEYLLRKRYLGHKLILTGRTDRSPDARRFIADHNLENDVILLHGLSLSELSAFYKLADLAVNPSLSEGGCPFTFSEALSVGTPVVMSRIPVAEEILTDPGLREITFFDPYDWLDCARRMEWAITHRDDMLVVQRNAFAALMQRTWSDVVQEHVRVLDRLAEQTSGVRQP